MAFIDELHSGLELIRLFCEATYDLDVLALIWVPQHGKGTNIVSGEIKGVHNDLSRLLEEEGKELNGVQKTGIGCCIDCVLGAIFELFNGDLEAWHYVAEEYQLGIGILLKVGLFLLWLVGLVLPLVVWVTVLD